MATGWLPKLRTTIAVAFALVLSASFGAESAALAETRTEHLAHQLKTADDFKVRTQAALALGATADPAAVAPLCGGLGDSEASVRVAAAAALGKLGMSDGAKCLKTARAKESDKDVIAQIDQSLGKLGASDPPAPGPDTKTYVMIEITNKTKRSNGEIDGIVRAAMQGKLLASRGVAVAPKSESQDASGKVAKSKGLKGYHLIAAVGAPSYSGGNLAVTINVTMMTLPENAIKATFAPTLTQEGTNATDTDGETILMKMASEKAVDSFMKVVASL